MKEKKLKTYAAVAIIKVKAINAKEARTQIAKIRRNSEVVKKSVSVKFWYLGQAKSTGER